MITVKIKQEDFDCELDKAAKGIVEADDGFNYTLNHAPTDNLRVLLMINACISENLKPQLANLKLQDKVIEYKMQRISERLHELDGVEKKEIM